MDPIELFIKILIDYIRENCNNVRELSGKCQGISYVVARGNPVSYDLDIEFS